MLLQALVLHLASTLGRQNSHASWVLSGVCIRSAQRLGMHRDGEALGLPPLETELRRRVWWHMVLLDFRFALASGFTPTSLGACDTRMPTNVNDEDIASSTTNHPENSPGPTDMIICLITSGLAKSMAERPDISEALTTIEMNAISGSRSRGCDMAKFVSDVEDHLEMIVGRFCNPEAGPLHIAALQMKSAMTQKISMIANGPRQGAADRSSPNERADNLFTLAVEATEHFANLLRKMRDGNFLWFVLQYFEQDLFTYMLARLCHRTAGSIVDRAWNVLPVIFAHFGEIVDPTTALCSTIETFLFRSWRSRQEHLLLQLGYLPETPEFVRKVEDSLRTRGQVTSPLDRPEAMERRSGTDEFHTAFWDMMGWGLVPDQSFIEPTVGSYTNWFQ
ncbi:C6 zinc finger protein [Colletotrichum simmondsii]|uniref:C6 zinc finger protein n=1 Tax=Colletotrichum simmondsii TaxID=703756 RepID=A0A135TA74_9PEZI|nr:C6 zinc finger protein [Colletotrichum simmondsii]